MISGAPREDQVQAHHLTWLLMTWFPESFAPEDPPLSTCSAPSLLQASDDLSLPRHLARLELSLTQYSPWRLRPHGLWDETLHASSRKPAKTSPLPSLLNWNHPTKQYSQGYTQCCARSTVRPQPPPRTGGIRRLSYHSGAGASRSFTGIEGDFRTPYYQGLPLPH